MGTFNQNILPASSGLNLGSLLQSWNVYANTITVINNVTALSNVTGSISVAPVNLVNLVTMTLTGNITTHTFTGTSLAAGSIVVYKIVQNNTGGYTFAWPAAFVQPPTVGASANQATWQAFMWDGTNCVPLGPGIYNP